MALPPTSQRAVPCLVVGNSAVLRAFVLLTVLTTVVGCQQRGRRNASSCDDGTQCDSGVCYHGLCAQPCTTDTECGVLLCLDGVCQAAGAPCDDGNPCTLGGWVAGKCLTHTGDVDCAHVKAECVVGVCDPKSKAVDPCVANADPPQLEKVCQVAQHPGKTWLCAAGGPGENGCKCGLWQGELTAPANPATKLVGPGRLAGAAKAGAGVLAVGWTDWPKRRVGWITRMDVGARARVSVPVTAGPNVETQALHRVAVAGGTSGWLAVGTLGKPAQGWVVRFAPESQSADGLWQLTSPWQKALVPSMAAAGELHDVAVSPAGVWLAVGTAISTQGQSAAWLVKLDDAGTVLGQDTIALPTSVTATSLTGVAARQNGFVAVGEVSTPQGKRGWLLLLDGNGKVLNQQILVPPLANQGSLQGVALAPSGEVAAFGWATFSNGHKNGWVAHFTAALQPDWHSTPSFEGAGVWVAGALSADGKWIAAGSVAADTKGFAASLKGNEPLGFANQVQANDLVAVVPVSEGFVLVGNGPGQKGNPAGGWMMRFAKSPEDAKDSLKCAQ